MDTVTLTRLSSTADGTFGNLVYKGQQVAVTVERPWKDNKPEVSCIPAGTYVFCAYRSPTKGDVWMAQDVPGRSDIEMHSANLASELRGCIAPGRTFGDFNGVKGVTSSKLTMYQLKATLPPTFSMTITDPLQPSSDL